MSDMDAEMRAAPTFSVVIPNYNYGRFLAAALDSVLQQAGCTAEVIVVDDASTDNSRDVLAAYASRVTLVLLTQNRGQINAYNEGYARATGEFVIFLDADDLLLPTAFTQIALAFKDDAVTKVHWRATLVNVQGESIGGWVPSKLVSGDMADLLLHHRILYPSPPGSANAYRRTSLARFMPLPTDSAEKHGADFFTIYGSALTGSVAIAGFGQPLSQYRIHNPASSASTLSFGNAAQSYDEKLRLSARVATFTRWVTSWSHGAFKPAPGLTEFSIEKNAFAQAIYSQSGYFAGLSQGAAQLADLTRSIWFRPGSLFERSALQAIMIALWVLPRPLGRPLAKYLCDPASR